MSAAERLEDTFPHGTSEGFNLGCRGAGGCPAGREHGLSCQKARTLAAGDYQYARLVGRGESPAGIARVFGLVPEVKDAPALRPLVPMMGALDRNHTATPDESAPLSGGRRRWTQAESAQVVELNGEGLSDSEIGRRIGRTQSIVSNYRRRLGLQAPRDRKSEAQA